MNEYEEFGTVYDRLTNDIDYSSYADFLDAIFIRYGKKPELMLDLACGSGSLIAELARRGYDMIGVDASVTMLQAAREKTDGLNVLLLEQDMADFELYGTVDAILSTLDSVNHITDKRVLYKMFRLVKNYLNPGGLFVFDLNTPYKLETVLGSNTFVYDENDVFCIWENEYSKRAKICTFYLTFFVKEHGRYTRFDEIHEERAYTPQEILTIANRAGLKALDVFGSLACSKPKKQDERNFFILSN